MGAALLSIAFVRDFGWAQGLWFGLFHSVSAFCNAGFDLMGQRAHFCSLTAYSADPLVSLTIAGLIVLGGIGFLTWEDFKTHKFHLRAYRMQSKVILSTTFLLILIPAVFFYFFEFSRAPWADMDTGEKVLSSIFQSITPRTAGFNTVDLPSMSEPSQSLTTCLLYTSRCV